MQLTKIEDLVGLWRRSLIVRGDGSRDDKSWVRWLQGPSDYADLRQPAGRPDFALVNCLRDLTPTHLAWMAAQDGFAGTLLAGDGIFEWRRDIDFQPPGPTPDRGRLSGDGDLMIEEGYHSPYVEHWHRVAPVRPPVLAVRLSDRTDGCAGQIVRVADLFMYARARTGALPAAPDLVACIAGADSLAKAQDMADCEIAFGIITPGWTIEYSTLPFREGRALGFKASPGRVETRDVSADGREFVRSWDVVAMEEYSAGENAIVRHALEA
jgi:hypothetical protein